MASGQLDQICAAIEDLAAAGRDDIAIQFARLAAVWGMVADADPGLARRLPDYLTAGVDVPRVAGIRPR